MWPSPRPPRSSSSLASTAAGPLSWTGLLSWACLLLGFFALGQLSRGQTPAVEPRERLSLDSGWLFHLGDIPFPVPQDHDATYQSTKAGKASGAAAPDFDDSAWDGVRLPHDWVISQPFSEQANVSQGYRARGVAWYRRHFVLPETDRGRHLELQFDGVATHCTVWVNGILMQRNFCGYTGFSIDLDAIARFGGELNSIAVRVDANPIEGWWYEGGGLYRHVWLERSAPLHIEQDGVWANPLPARADQLDDWVIPVAVSLQNSSASEQKAKLLVELLAPDLHTLQSGSVAVVLNAFSKTTTQLSLQTRNPKLWSPDSPLLYTVRVRVLQGDLLVDDTTQPCGFRTLRFDPDLGFFLNGQPLKIQGVCNHQDHAGVGVALPDALWDERILKTKAMGANAWRCSHNPPAREFLDACDRLGLLVLDENRLFSTSAENEAQLAWMIRRDRNHPSVILWSVFNEEPMQATEQGFRMVRELTALAHQLDPSRPVTAAQSWGFSRPSNVSQAVDVVGFNYQVEPYDAFHEAHPKQPLLSTEDGSAYMTRDEWVQDESTHRIASFDEQAASWGASHRDSWLAIQKRPFLAGGFVWTGFDYHGEPTPHAWPSVSSFFGCLDLCGFPKAAFYLRQALWIHNRPILKILPHWTWPGKDGQTLRVLVASNAYQVALELNGQRVGAPLSPGERGSVEWSLAYQPGILRAIALDRSGQVLLTDTVRTAGPASQLRLSCERLQLDDNGLDLASVRVEAADDAGIVVPDAQHTVHFTVSAAGRLLGVGNGDPNSHEAEVGPERSLFHGLALALVQSSGLSASEIVIEARAPGLLPARLALPLRHTAKPASLPESGHRQRLSQWSRSSGFASRPDIQLVRAANDMNSWQDFACDRLQSVASGNWILCELHFSAWQAVARQGGQLRLPGLRGLVQASLNGRLIPVSREASTGDGIISLPPQSGAQTLRLLLQAGPDGLLGFTDVPSLEP